MDTLQGIAAMQLARTAEALGKTELFAADPSIAQGREELIRNCVDLHAAAFGMDRETAWVQVTLELVRLSHDV